ncbi:MAG: MBL fold metallo-hydrolase [Ignavibacteria bacterium]
MKRKKFIEHSLLIDLGSLFFNNTLSSGSEPKSPLYKPDIGKWKNDEIDLCWIGHSTVLINFYGTYILTDPALLPRVGIRFLGFTYGPLRYMNPALNIDEMPQPDLILISHAHMDHMDYQTLKILTNKFPQKIQCVTAKNTKDIIQDLSWKSLNEVDWNEKLDAAEVKVTGIEVIHNGWRYPFEMDRTDGNQNGRSFNAYLIEKNKKKIFFAGDTAYTDKWKFLSEENIEIAILPVGGYVPKYYYHCNPEEALKMADEFLKADYFIPIHTKTFDTPKELIEPLEWLDRIKSQYKTKVVINDIGQSFSMK